MLHGKVLVFLVGDLIYNELEIVNFLIDNSFVCFYDLYLELWILIPSLYEKIYWWQNANDAITYNPQLIVFVTIRFVLAVDDTSAHTCFNNIDYENKYTNSLKVKLTATFEGKAFFCIAF